jgi:hypothetical protein
MLFENIIVKTKKLNKFVKVFESLRDFPYCGESIGGEVRYE